jgi:hypothetical protein
MIFGATTIASEDIVLVSGRRLEEIAAIRAKHKGADSRHFK